MNVVTMIEHRRIGTACAHPSCNTAQDLLQFRKFHPSPLINKLIHGIVIVNVNGILPPQHILPLVDIIGESVRHASRFGGDVEQARHEPAGRMGDAVGKDVIVDVHEIVAAILFGLWPVGSDESLQLGVGGGMGREGFAAGIERGRRRRRRVRCCRRPAFRHRRGMEIATVLVVLGSEQ